ncbi:MAG: polysaccharide deacetylase [Chloroflexi bacterium]|nr:polysaccharide deacetylase [Chloroflexota bacterium]
MRPAERFPWPDGAQCAVALTFDVDAESLWIGRDPENAHRPGVLSQGAYSPKVAVPKILELLARYGIKGTFFIPGEDVDAWPDAPRQIDAAGHELGHHGYHHIRADTSKLDVEVDAFDRAFRAYEKAVGKRPVGFRSPSWDFTANTLRLLAERGFHYSTNMMDQVTPYIHPGTSIVELPVQWTLDDAPFFTFGLGERTRPIAPAAHAFQVWLEEFEGIYAWGGLFNLTMHPQMIGRPGRMLMLERLIQTISRYPNVWFATCLEIADWSRAQLGT